MSSTVVRTVLRLPFETFTPQGLSKHVKLSTTPKHTDKFRALAFPQSWSHALQGVSNIFQ
ncbi:uncharacterized protein ASCRUDRAFT_80893 [Ascoidea rubescens DSM 1968]|uniref:Uncharacterized protein n=1 Tax=Ascoidea rubescens DSM 1968 TaxID=1344418 RepID=A0A1D2VI41_9ASCO|nr:hypothetical protein ASCRUDRAFT_80893 [Ascoidea rubescens DSM 1968]ODV61147.1 hypothetical protein ASCRUDRAFT_80893 [Ascoidea rubescens DSM 1968]